MAKPIGSNLDFQGLTGLNVRDPITAQEIATKAYVDANIGGGGNGGTVYDTDQIGTIKSFVGTTIPTNWMLADGRSLVRANYPQLADVLGVSVGAINFNLPNLSHKFILSAQANLSDILTEGGEETHLLTTAEMPSHTHIQNSHNHTQQPHDHAGRRFWNWDSSGGSLGGAGTRTADTPIADTAVNNPTTAVNQNAGGGGVHNNMPPWIALAQIIKVTGVTIDSGGALVGATGPPGNGLPAGWSVLKDVITYDQASLAANTGAAYDLTPNVTLQISDILVYIGRDNASGARHGIYTLNPSPVGPSPYKIRMHVFNPTTSAFDPVSQGYYFLIFRGT